MLRRVSITSARLLNNRGPEQKGQPQPNHFQQQNQTDNRAQARLAGRRQHFRLAEGDLVPLAGRVGLLQVQQAHNMLTRPRGFNPLRHTIAQGRIVGVDHHRFARIRIVQRRAVQFHRPASMVGTDAVGEQHGLAIEGEVIARPGRARCGVKHILRSRRPWLPAR